MKVLFIALLFLKSLCDDTCQDPDRNLQDARQKQKEIAEHNFKAIDQNQDNLISIDEMNDYLEGTNPVMFYKIDSNNDGVVSFDEFAKKFQDISDDLLRIRHEKYDTKEYKYMQSQFEQTISRYWSLIDFNQDKFIDYDELHQFFKQTGKGYHTEQQFQIIDVNNDQKITFPEFKTWLVKNARQYNTINYAKQKMKEDL